MAASGPVRSRSARTLRANRDELITNSFKHAFPQQRTGLIEVSFRCAESECTLAVCDNRIGVPNDTDLHSAKSLGFRLLNLLVQQLKRSVTVDRSSGTCLSVTFPIQSA